MANKNAFKRGIMSLLGLSSREETAKEVRRVSELQDLEQRTTKHTSLDPTLGRTAHISMPHRSLTTSGHFVPNLDEGILGECIHCRSQFDRAGQPNRITLVPRAEGGGGVCCKCLRTFCCDHGRLDEERRFWCESCYYEDKLSQAERIVIGVIVKGLTGAFRDKDE